MDPVSNRTALLAEVRAHLEWELECGGIGVPRASALSRVTTARVESSALPPSGPEVEVPAALAQAEPPAAVRPAQAMTAPPGPSESSVPAAARATPALPDHPETGRADAALADEPGLRTPVAAASPPEVGHAVFTPEARRVRLRQLAEEVAGCTRCELAKGRTQTVFARGNPDSALVFVGEGPGQDEDRSGVPFVGPAGQLLDKMVTAMGYQRDDVYICNVVKCRPPNNRTPLPSEAGACSSYLGAQLEAVAPRVIVALGRCAAENLGLVQEGSAWRGRWGSFRGVQVMPTYHPAFLLRSPEYKRPVWEDLQKVMARLKAGPTE